MARKLLQDGKTYYICEICGVTYADKVWAEKCTEWCSEHEGTCSLEVVMHAVTLDEPESSS